jgi:hypothetical protein
MRLQIYDKNRISIDAGDNVASASNFEQCLVTEHPTTCNLVAVFKSPREITTIQFSKMSHYQDHEQNRVLDKYGEMIAFAGKCPDCGGSLDLVESSKPGHLMQIRCDVCYGHF